MPEDLIRTAVEAEKRGDARGMRRAYANFLLQEKLVSPTMRSLIVESYLKLGDSFHLEAEQEGDSAAAEEGDRIRRIREEHR